MAFKPPTGKPSGSSHDRRRQERDERQKQQATINKTIEHEPVRRSGTLTSIVIPNLVASPGPAATTVTSEIKKSSKPERLRLSRSDSFTVIFGLLGLFIVIYLPQLWAKIIGLLCMCVATVWFIRNAHWTAGWSRLKEIVVSALAVSLMLGICIPQFVAQWKTEHPKDTKTYPSTQNAAGATAIHLTNAVGADLEGLTVTGRPGANQTGIELNGSSGVQVNEPEIRGTDHGIVVNNSKNVAINKSKISGGTKPPCPTFVDGQDSKRLTLQDVTIESPCDSKIVDAQRSKDMKVNNLRLIKP